MLQALGHSFKFAVLGTRLAPGYMGFAQRCQTAPACHERALVPGHTCRGRGTAQQRQGLHLKRGRADLSLSMCMTTAAKVGVLESLGTPSSSRYPVSTCTVRAGWQLCCGLALAAVCACMRNTACCCLCRSSV